MTMKPKLPLLALATASLLAQAAPPVGDVTLAWDPPASGLSTGQVFRLYYSPTLATPMTNWIVLTNISGMATQATVRITPGAAFFSLTTSNLWGESVFSGVAATPPLPLSPLLSIQGVR